MYSCFGDSITKGVPGVSYLKYLDNKQNFKNYGLGGDTLIGLSERIKRHATNIDNTDYIIQIGTNDILLPFLSRYSTKWAVRINDIIRSGRVPCDSVQQFVEKYTQLLSLLHNYKKRIIVISIPCIGEDIFSELNKEVDIYNEAIQGVVQAYNVGFIDFNGWQKSIFKQYNIAKPYFITKEPLNMVLDSITTQNSLLRSRISNIRNLYLTVDGCHLNDRGAEGLAHMVQMLDQEN